MKGKIHTRTGDAGTTGLFDGSRVPKDDLRIECLGCMDELTSAIGLLRVALDTDHPWQKELQGIQIKLMDAMTTVATPSASIKAPQKALCNEDVKYLESRLDEIESSLSSTTNCFLLPGGNEISARCHLARTQTRQAERRIAALHRQAPLPEALLKYINRLSDLFFKLSRAALEEDKISEERWKSFLYSKPST